MDQRKLLAYCLAKPGAWRDEPWEGDVVAKVGGRIFAFLGDRSVGVKCGPSREVADEWLARYPDDARASPYIGRSGWNVLNLGGAIPDDEVLEAIDASYETIVSKLPQEGEALSVATWRDVERIARSLPDTEIGTGEVRSYAVNGKAYAWERPLRKQDLVALGDAAPQGAILCVRTPDVGAKEALLAAGVPGCFTTPHFNGYPAILIHLTRARVGDLREVLTEGWLCRAPKKVARSYLDSSPRR